MYPSLNRFLDLGSGSVRRNPTPSRSSRVTRISAELMMTMIMLMMMLMMMIMMMMMVMMMQVMVVMMFKRKMDVGMNNDVRTVASGTGSYEQGSS